MRDAFKTVAKWALAQTSFRLVRAPINRFQAIEESLQHLKELGYAPGMIIDGGAHLGDFALLAQRLFPATTIHLIEPQPACQNAVRQLALQHGFTVHPVALVSPEETGKPIFMAAGIEASTGAYIVPPADRVPANVRVNASTLDQIFGPRVSPKDRVLLKLDLQGYELRALRGAVDVLRSVEVLLTEVSFFAQAYEPSIFELVEFLDKNDFDLFDVAALSARARDNRLKQGDLLFVRRGSNLAVDTRWA
jgi:FkbM family methyltransferase